MQPDSIARSAGLLYLLVIALGLTSEIAVRAPLLALGPPDVAARISETETLFRLSVAADAAMVAADVALPTYLIAVVAETSFAVALLGSGRKKR